MVDARSRTAAGAGRSTAGRSQRHGRCAWARTRAGRRRAAGRAAAGRPGLLLLRPDRLSRRPAPIRLAGLADAGHQRSRRGRAVVVGTAGGERHPGHRAGVRRARRAGGGGHCGPRARWSGGLPPGPVAVSAGDRALFFVATRGAPATRTSGGPASLDCEPDDLTECRACAGTAGTATCSRRPPATAAAGPRGGSGTRRRARCRTRPAARVARRRLRRDGSMTGERCSRDRGESGRAVRARQRRRSRAA